MPLKPTMSDRLQSIPEVIVLSRDSFHPSGKLEMKGTLEEALEYLKSLTRRAKEPDTFLAAAGTRFFVYRFEAESVEWPGLEKNSQQLRDVLATANKPTEGDRTPER